MRAPGIVHYESPPDEMLPASTASLKQAGAGNKQGSKQMVPSQVKGGGGVGPQSSYLTPENERVKFYRKWYHELDKRRLELKKDCEEDVRQHRLLDSEIRCLEELIVLSTELETACPTPLGVENGRIVPHQLHPIPGKNKLGSGVDTWPADSPLPPVEGLDLSLITDMLMLSATSPWTVYVAERAQWTLCYISPSVKRILGWKQTELVGSVAWDGCHPDDISDVQRMLSDGDKIGGRTQIVCYRRMRRNCAYATVQATGRQLGTRWYAWVELLISDVGELASSGSPDQSWTNSPEPILALSPVASPAHSTSITTSLTSKSSKTAGDDQERGTESPPNQSRKSSPASQNQSTSLHRSSFTSTRESLETQPQAHRRTAGSLGGNYATLPYGPDMLALSNQLEKGRISGSLTGKMSKAITAAGETGKLRSTRSLEEEGEDSGMGSRSLELRQSSRSGSERDDSRAILPVTPGVNSEKSSLNSLDSSEEVENIWREGARALPEMSQSLTSLASHSFPVAPTSSAPPNPPPSVARRRTGQAAGSPGGTMPGKGRVGGMSPHNPMANFSPDDLGLIKGQKVLLVEDDVVNRTIGQRILESLECQVTVTCNGQEALEVMKGKLGNEITLYQQNGPPDGEELPPRFDLVLMDLLMPVLDGLGAVEQFREWEALQVPQRKRMLIFAVTSNVTDGDMVKCAQSGFDEFVSKPLTLDKLIHRLQGVVKQRNSGKPRSLESSL